MKVGGCYLGFFCLQIRLLLFYRTLKFYRKFTVFFLSVVSKIPRYLFTVFPCGFNKFFSLLLSAARLVIKSLCVAHMPV